jgi:hypothetical protein
MQRKMKVSIGFRSRKVTYLYYCNDSTNYVFMLIFG